MLFAILKGDEYLSREFDLIVPSDWSENGKVVFELTLDRLRQNPEEAKWHIYLPIETSSNTLLGTCGFKGIPNANGAVEIGYEIAVDYRNRGFATELVQLLIDIAFADESVKEVQAQTLVSNKASERVLEKCEFKIQGRVEAGKVDKWIIER